jgi:exosome complex exonuclease DIS3/RRP44
MDISKKLKDERMRAGALFLASQEFKFKTDDEHLNPTDMTKYQTFEANSMIEEWMLFANVAAAKAIYRVYPRWALLRRHQPPDPSSFSVLNEALQRRLGFTLDTSSSLALNMSLDRAVDPDDPFFNELIRMMTTRCLKQAQYFSSGEAPYEEYLHYGLAMPIYTHFTSPIRRYADVIVHRQLCATLKLSNVSAQHTDSARMNSLAENLNYRHEQAQKAGRDSKNLFTGFYLRNFADGIVPPETGYIIKTSDTHLFVLVPKYGQESKVDRDEVADSESYRVLDRVRVGIQLKQDGDVMRTKLVFSILGPLNTTCGRPEDTTLDNRLVEEILHDGKTEKEKNDAEDAEGQPPAKVPRHE